VFEMADLANVSDTPLRRVTFWADRGALVADPDTDKGGQGTHRTFSRDEAIIACILSAFYLDEAPIARLIDVAITIRALLKNKDTRQDIENAIHGKGQAFLFLDQMASPYVYAGHYKPDGTKTYSGICDYAMEQMTVRNRKANIIALHACLTALKSYVPGGRGSRARDARGAAKKN
jgi:hypothetical protein